MLAVLAALAALAACSVPPEPLQLPAAALSAAYLDGDDPATGSQATATFAVAIEVLALGAPPPGRAVENAATAILGQSQAPFRGRSQLPIGTRWFSGAAAAAWIAAAADLPASERQSLGAVSAVIGAARLVRVTAGDLPLPVLEFLADDTGFDTVLWSRTPTFPQPERLQLARWDPATPAVLFVPAELESAAGYAVVISPGSAPDAGELAAVRAATAAPAADLDHELPLRWQLALDAIGEHNRRPALLGLADHLGLHRVLDLLLAADAALLLAIVDRLRAVDPDGPDPGFAVEQAAWQALLPRLSRDDATPPLRAAAIRHLGALADDPGSLEVALARATSGAAFAAALREENVAALADRSPSVRVRAHDLLSELGAAIPGYDPLGPEPERRAALRDHYEAGAAASNAAEVQR